MALIAAGYGPADGSFHLSEQNVMDCNSTGACSGDDNTTVLQIAETVGILTDAQYGPYEGRRRSCKVVASPQPYKIGSWGFCDGTGNGVTDTQLIKNCMVAYGPIGIGIAADNDFENSPAGFVFLGSGATVIDHDVILVGWQDDTSIPGGGYWILRNSWGTSWCEQGYQRIAYGANNVGTEAVWASAVPLGPVPVPPTSIAA